MLLSSYGPLRQLMLESEALMQKHDKKEEDPIRATICSLNQNIGWYIWDSVSLICNGSLQYFIESTDKSYNDILVDLLQLIGTPFCMEFSSLIMEAGNIVRDRELNQSDVFTLSVLDARFNDMSGGMLDEVDRFIENN